VERVVYLLAVTHSLEFVSVDGPSTSRNSSAPPAPASLPPQGAARSSIPPAIAALAELKQEIHERLARPQASHYELLGVEKTAATKQIRVAFVALAKRFHPDRVGHGLPELSDASTRLFAKLLEAARVLSDPLQRARYDRGLEDGSIPVVSDRPPGVPYDVTVALRRAESMLAHANHAGAEREMAIALAGDPEHPEVIALSAWLEAHQPDADLRRLWAKVSAATDDVSTVRVHLFRGQLLKRLGRHASALQEFRRVLELEPRHIDAAREVRIYERNRDQWLTQPPRSRSGTFPSGASPGGFLGWLKRKS
jgi:curved DNA-binding protein CbpA